MVNHLQDKKHRHSTISRRTFLKGMATAVAGLVAAACQPKSSTPTSQPISAASSQPVSPTTSVAASSQPASPSASATTSTPYTGTARGIKPGRVVWVHNPTATAWNGTTGHWWEDDNLKQDVVSSMLSQATQKQTDQSDDASAWNALFKYFNEAHGKSGKGYQPGEKIAVKINLNISAQRGYQDNGSFTSPQVIYALLKQLITEAGVAGADITVYDALRCIPDAIYKHLQVPELTGVHFADWTGGDGREVASRDLNSQIHWSVDVKGNPTYLPTAVTQATYLINAATIKGHNLAGVTLCAKNHFGTICSDLEGQPTQQGPQGANIHPTIAAHDYSWGGDPAWTFEQRPMGTYNALVDLMGHKDLGAKTVLFILDGFYVSHDQSTNVTADCRWKSAPFNGQWTSSLFVSQDGVAIDSVGYDFISSEPTITALEYVLPPGNTAENYLHEASLANNPPSGTHYNPNNDSTGLASLGVHEHWNNSTDKKYSRNLGTGNGIELVSMS